MSEVEIRGLNVVFGGEKLTSSVERGETMGQWLGRTCLLSLAG